MFSFERKKWQNQIRDLLNRIANLSTPNMPPFDGDSRGELRVNRALPVLLVPWEDEIPVVSDAVTALTKDLSDRGVSIVLHQPFRVQQLVIGFHVADRGDDYTPARDTFLLGHVRQNVSLGGGFWQLGIEFERVLVTSSYRQLEQMLPLMESLAPRNRTIDLPTKASIG